MNTSSNILNLVEFNDDWKPVLKQEQTEAQKDATRLLKAKFRYPTCDPQPNIVQDKRAELEKIQSILRIT